ncbi:hypothetical protein CHUAL_009832 [Chamberlinius hualienensis]
MSAVKVLLFSAALAAAFVVGTAEQCQPLSTCSDDECASWLCMYSNPACKNCVEGKADKDSDTCVDCFNTYLADSEISHLATICDQCENPDSVECKTLMKDSLAKCFGDAQTTEGKAKLSEIAASCDDIYQR